MIALLLAIAAQAVSPSAPSALGAIGQQKLPAKGCAAYLWSAVDRQLVAMASADPAMLRVSLDGRIVDLARSAQGGADGNGAKLGFADGADYRGKDVTARLTMDIVQQDGLTAGAKVPQGSLQVDRPGQDGIVVPVAGLIGCRT